MVSPLKKESSNMVDVTGVIYSCCEELSSSINQLKLSIDRYEERKRNRIASKESLKVDSEVLNDRD